MIWVRAFSAYVLNSTDRLAICFSMHCHKAWCISLNAIRQTRDIYSITSHEVPVAELDWHLYLFLGEL